MKLEEIFTYENLYKSWKSISKGKKNEDKFIEYSFSLTKNLKDIEWKFKHNRYPEFHYYSFVITEPKERVVWATDIEGRIIQDCLCKNCLRDYFDPLLIDSNAACRRGKGTDYSIRQLRDNIYRAFIKYDTDFYYIKFDVKKYFDSIDHTKLKEKLKDFPDSDVKDYLFYIIDSYETKPGRGLPLGNQTSQWLALIYLNNLDWKLHEDADDYVRYMDDSIAIVHTKQYAIKILSIIHESVSDDCLILNKKTAIIKAKDGIGYLGWNFYILNNGRIIQKLKRTNIKRTKRNFRITLYRYKEGQISKASCKQSINSIFNHLNEGNTNQLQNNLKKIIKENIVLE